MQLKNTGGTVLQTTTTDANGNYLFDLATGNYLVSVVTPTGYVVSARDQGANDNVDSDIDPTSKTTGTVTIIAGQQNLTVDAGLYQKASLGDRVWVDTDKDGVQDAGELGVAGVKVYLLNGAGVQIGSATTNATGDYLFGNLTPGTYSVRFDLATLPVGYVATLRDALAATDATDSDADPTTGRTINTVLDSGENDLSWDLGIKGNVGIDIEKLIHGEYLVQGAGGGEGLTPGFWKNHSAYGPAPLSGWPETGLSPDASYETIFGVNVLGTATPTLLEALGTGGGGIEALMRHSSAALLNASNPYVSYAYTAAQIISMTQTAINGGNAATIESTKNLFATQNELGADLSTLAVSGSTLVVTPDVDADTLGSGPVIPVGGKAVFTYIVKNTGSVELSNVSVVDDRIATLTFVGGDTDGDGRLDVNETWTYKATETVLSGVSYVNIGTATGRDAVSGTTATDSDAAHYTTPALGQSLGDRVWLDTNANGIQDAGEQGIAGVTVQLKASGSTTVLKSTVTDSAGNFGFDVAAGQYRLTIVTPTGHFVSAKNSGTDNKFDAISKTTDTITVAAGQQVQSVDAGLFTKAVIGDRVWYDSNRNGIQDLGESGVAGVKVTLKTDAGTTVATALTNSNGNYSFSANPGTYQLFFDSSGVATATTNWTRLNNRTSTQDNDSDVDSLGKSVLFTVAAGDTQNQWDAGLTPIVIDLDGNGIQTVSRANSGGAFDLFGNGGAVKSGWISGSDGFLAVDKNGNGKIDGIDELFGGTAKGAGFANLAAYDSNGDGFVNDADAAFGQLMIWRDANGNHATDAGELMTLAQAGVASLTVAYTELPFVDAQGNLHLERSTATLANGSAVSMTDVYFNVSAEDAAAAGVALPTMAELLGNDSALDHLLGASTEAVANQKLSADVAQPGCDAAETLRRLTALTHEGSHQAMAA